MQLKNPRLDKGRKLSSEWRNGCIPDIAVHFLEVMKSLFSWLAIVYIENWLFVQIRCLSGSHHQSSFAQLYMYVENSKLFHKLPAFSVLKYQLTKTLYCACYFTSKPDLVQFDDCTHAKCNHLMVTLYYGLAVA